MTMETSLKTVLRGFFIIGGVSGVLVLYKKIDTELAAAIDRGDWGFLFAFMVTSVLVLGCFWIASELSIKTNPNDTIKACDTAIEKNSLDIAAWHNKGIALAMLGKYDEAINAYNKAIEINSRDADVWHNKGAALNALGEYESAIQCFEKAIEINPKFTEAWNDKGTSLLDMRRYENAIMCFEKAIELNPSSHGHEIIRVGLLQTWVNTKTPSMHTIGL